MQWDIEVNRGSILCSICKVLLDRIGSRKGRERETVENGTLVHWKVKVGRIIVNIQSRGWSNWKK